MKIICVGRNYAAHAEELKNEIPDEPVIFLKPETSILENNNPFYLPDFSNDIHYEAELVLRINRNGKHISEKFAHKYYTQITLGIDFTARDIQSKLKEKRISWELSKAFDNSAVVGEILEINKLKDQQHIIFRLDKNGETVQKGDSAFMLFSFDKLISFVSKYITLKRGDLIFTGTPAGVGKVKIGDRLTGYIENQQIFDFLVK